MEDLFTFSWTIENFSMCHQRVSEYLKSPTFEIETMYNIKGYILVYLKGKKHSDSIFCDCYTDIPYRPIKPLQVSISLTSNLDSQRKKISKFIYNNGTCLGNITREKKEIFGERKKYLSEDLLTVELRIKKLNSNSSSSIAYSAKTIVQVEQHKFSILVPPYMLAKKGELKETETYRTQHRVFEIIFYFQEFQAKKISLVIHVRRIEDSNDVLFSNCQVSLRGRHGQLNCLVEGEHFFQDNTTWTLSCIIGSEEEKWLVQNPNSLRCCFNESDGTMLTTLQKCQFPSQHQNQKGILQAEAKCTNFLMKLYNDKDTSDVVLQVEERAFQAHVNVLGVASPVFKAMFANDMKEKRTNTVIIEDLDADTVHKMLLFIYSGTTEDLQMESGLKLYAAADKYQIVELKHDCSSYLLLNLCVENVCEILGLADLHQEEELKVAACNYIYDHNKEVLNSEGWTKFMESHIYLASKVMFHICRQK